MVNRIPFETGEWYHCYSRGVDKRTTFLDVQDYQRFVQLLYISNAETAVPRSALKLQHKKIFELDKGKPLVAIAAYTIMPNHYHVLVREINPGGVAKFMQKLGTSYSMYFNRKYQRVGNLFVKPFRSRHVDNDVYLRRVVDYIHINPVELFDPAWKSGSGKVKTTLPKSILEYAYTSFADHKQKKRPEKNILDPELVELLSAERPSVKAMLEDYHQYYKELAKKDEF